MPNAQSLTQQDWETQADRPDPLPRLLVIDDDHYIRNIIRVWLKNQYDVLGVGNAEEVVDLAEAFQPDLILLDINLPGTNGFTACRKLRRSRRLRATPVLFMTVRRDDNSFLESLYSGGDSYIPKPFEKAELVGRIKYLLEP